MRGSPEVSIGYFICGPFDASDLFHLWDADLISVNATHVSPPYDSLR